MKRAVAILLLVGAIASAQADSSVEDILRDAPRLDAPEPGYPGRSSIGPTVVPLLAPEPPPKATIDLRSIPSFDGRPASVPIINPWAEQYRLFPGN